MDVKSILHKAALLLLGYFSVMGIHLNLANDLKRKELFC